MPSERSVIEPGCYDDIIDDAHIAVARSHPSNRLYPNMKVKTLPPRLWERLRLQLQEEYRRATGERHAILVIEQGEPT